MTINDLQEFGANTAEGLGRLLNNEDFYIRMVKMAAADDSGIETLKAAIAQKDLKAAFDAAHGLKGSLGNLALSPLYDPIAEMTELLRVETDTDYSGYLKEIETQWSKLKELCAN